MKKRNNTQLLITKEPAILREGGDMFLRLNISSHSGCHLRHSAHIELTDDREKEGSAHTPPCHRVICAPLAPSVPGV